MYICDHARGSTAGVVQTANGPYFLKLTGPQATVTKWNDAFDRFVASLRYAP